MSERESAPFSPPSGGAYSLPATASYRRPVNLRSLLLGLMGVTSICLLTYFNDNAMNNTLLIGNYLPIGLLLFFLVVIFVLNAPLLKWFPRLALTRGELAVAMGMVLVGCAIPASGLMNYLPGSIVGMHYHNANTQQYNKFLDSVNPRVNPKEDSGPRQLDWLLPDFQSENNADRFNEPVINEFWNKAVVESDSFGARVRAVPWKLWLRPAISWSLFLAALWGAVLCMSAIVRRQWVENERLPFPIANVYLQLIEAPKPGRAFNQLFSNPVFWIGAAAVIFIHSLNALHSYFPKVVPVVPLGYDLRGLFDTPPLSYVSKDLTKTKVVFAIVGITYFLQSKVAFSLFAFYLLSQFAFVFYGGESEFTRPARNDQMFGALVVFIAMILWVGRHHWAAVLRHMVFMRRPNDAEGRYIPYSVAGWGLLLCCAGMVTWIWFAGASVMGAIVLVLMLMGLFLAMARIVAETGLIYAQIHVPLNRPWTYLSVLAGVNTTSQSFFLTAWLHQIFGHDLRESLPVFSTHAMRVADAAAYEGERNWRRTVPFALALVLALIVAFVVSGAATLYVEYNHMITLGEGSKDSIINKWGVDSSTVNHTMKPTNEFLKGQETSEKHSHMGHFGVGAGLTLVLSVLRLTVAWWPLHPLGYLLVFTAPIARIWLSLGIGWLLKALLVRFGGSRLYKSASPFFIGLIVGEAFAAAIWLITALVLYSMGMTYYIYNITEPG